MCWVYTKTKDGARWLYTVGYFAPYPKDPGLHWHAIKDFSEEYEAQGLVNYLNGGPR